MALTTKALTPRDQSEKEQGIIYPVVGHREKEDGSVDCDVLVHQDVYTKAWGEERVPPMDQRVLKGWNLSKDTFDDLPVYRWDIDDDGNIHSVQKID